MTRKIERIVCLILVASVGVSTGIALVPDDALKVGTVWGQIADTTPAQNPIEGVKIKIVARDGDAEFTTTTDANGEYKYAGLPAGRYLISVSKEGYDKRVGKRITVVDGGEHFVPLKMARKRNAKPRFIVEQEPTTVIVRAKRMNAATEQRIKQQIDTLPQRIAESIGRRYNLNEVDVKSLHKSIIDSIEEASLTEADNLNVFAEVASMGSVALLEVLLSHLSFEAVFSKYLSEAQFQDYLDFTAARRQRDRQAVAHRLTVSLDKELSLTADQREKVMELLLDTVENEAFPTSMGVLRIGSQEAVNLMFYKLDISLDGVLSEAQSKVWQGLIDKGIGGKHKVIFIQPEKVIEGGVEFHLNRKDVDLLGKRIRVEDNTVESEKQMKQIAEAKLVAHTELLGPLNERATRRLDLVTKGVVQQYIEAQDERLERVLKGFEMDLAQKVEAGEMNREQAAMGLQMMEKDLWDKEDGNEGRESSISDITDHPLYQQTIKDVLSEDAYARYSAYRAERKALRLQALRDIAVACMDTQLLLDDTQRRQLETTALRLISGSFSESKSVELIFFQLFQQTIDYEILTPWQQSEYERVLGPVVWKR